MTGIAKRKPRRAERAGRAFWEPKTPEDEASTSSSANRTMRDRHATEPAGKKAKK